MLEQVLQYDLFIALGVLGLTLLYLYTVGKDYAVTIILGLYMALGTVIFVPFLAELDFSLAGTPSWLTKVVLVLILVTVFSYLQIHNGYFEPVVVPSAWEVPVYAIIFSGMLVSATVGFMAPDAQAGLSDLFQMLFVEEPVSDAWFLLMPLSLLFIKGDA